VVQRPVQSDWKREIRMREDATLDQLRADLERGGLAGVRGAERAPEPFPEIAIAVLQLLDGTLIGMLSCSADAGEATIGRGRDAVIRIHDPYVSRRHATMHWDADGGTHILTDLSAQNGTFINGRRILVPTRVVDGSRIRLGSTELLYSRKAG
jgi:hypothetical protein